MTTIINWFIYQKRMLFISIMYFLENPLRPVIHFYYNYFSFFKEQNPRHLVEVVPGMTPPHLPLLTMDMLPLDTQLPEMERFTVELMKDIQGLGITIAGYVCEKGK